MFTFCQIRAGPTSRFCSSAAAGQTHVSAILIDIHGPWRLLQGVPIQSSPQIKECVQGHATIPR
jgi:hypothetical protein